MIEPVHTDGVTEFTEQCDTNANHELRLEDKAELVDQSVADGETERSEGMLSPGRGLKVLHHANIKIKYAEG